MSVKPAWTLSLVLVALAPAGCGMPPGHQGVATETPVKTVSLYYATDRSAKSEEPGDVRYGWERAYSAEGAGYQMGVCKVEIKRERNHDKVSPLPRFRMDLVSLVSTTTLDRDRFYERIRERIWYAGTNDTFVFVHGYNNTFEQAAIRTAEIWYDVGFEGPPIMFTWPSRGGRFWRGVFGYFADSETLKWSAEHLKTFLLELVAETSADRMFADEPARIHLIAHSMGARALSRSLMLIADELGRTDPPIFCDVILAAPDIDRDLFRDVIVLKLLRSRLAEHYTLYASTADAVIKTSQRLQVYPRVGNAQDGLVPINHEDFTTVDASALDGGLLALNHSYFVSEPRLIRDLIEVLRRSNRDPSAPGRLMDPRPDVSNVWVLKPDRNDTDHVVVEVE